MFRAASRRRAKSFVVADPRAVRGGIYAPFRGFLRSHIPDWRTLFRLGDILGIFHRPDIHPERRNLVPEAQGSVIARASPQRERVGTRENQMYRNDLCTWLDVLSARVTHGHPSCDIARPVCVRPVRESGKRRTHSRGKNNSRWCSSSADSLDTRQFLRVVLRTHMSY